MLNAFFSEFDISSSAKISEGLFHVTINAKIPDNFEQKILSLISELKSVHERDSFELLIEIDGETNSVQRNNFENDVEIKKFIEHCNDATNVSINLKIQKKIIDNNLSVYFFDALISYLSSAQLTEALKSFATGFTGQIRFQVFDAIDSFYSSSLSFSSQENEFNLKSIDDSRVRILSNFNDSSNSSGIPNCFLPSDFYLLNRSTCSKVNDFFDRCSSVLALAFLANSSELKSNDKFSYKLYGYKAVICKDESIQNILQFSKLLNQIYSWAYDSGSVTDKLGLIRNVLSIHLDEKGSLRIDSFVWEAIQSNYQIYLKGNIQSYLDVKNKLSELLFESIAKTSLLADELLSTLKNNIAIAITFLLTVVVINGVKDASVSSIFSNAYLYIVVLLIVFSFVWMFLMRLDVLSRYENGSIAIRDLLSNNYGMLLMSSEIDESISPTLARNKKFLTLQIKKYCWWWGLMNLLFISVFVIGNVVFTQDSFLTKTTKTLLNKCTEPTTVVAPASTVLTLIVDKKALQVSPPGPKVDAKPLAK